MKFTLLVVSFESHASKKDEDAHLFLFKFFPSCLLHLHLFLSTLQSLELERNGICSIYSLCFPLECRPSFHPQIEVVLSKSRLFLAISFFSLSHSCQLPQQTQEEDGESVVNGKNNSYHGYCCWMFCYPVANHLLSNVSGCFQHSSSTSKISS
jgi:hypothetical protein